MKRKSNPRPTVVEKAQELMEKLDCPLTKLLGATIGAQWRSVGFLNRNWSQSASNQPPELNEFGRALSKEELIHSFDLQCQVLERRALSSLLNRLAGNKLEFNIFFCEHPPDHKRYFNLYHQVHLLVLKFILLDRLLWANDEGSPGADVPVQERFKRHRLAFEPARELYRAVESWSSIFLKLSDTYSDFLRKPRTKFLPLASQSFAASKHRLRGENPAITSLLLGECEASLIGHKAMVQKNFAQAALGLILLSQCASSNDYGEVVEDVVRKMASKKYVSVEFLRGRTKKQNNNTYIMAILACAVYSPLILLQDSDPTKTRNLSIKRLYHDANIPFYNCDPERFSAEKDCWGVLLNMASNGFSALPSSLGKVVRGWQRANYFGCRPKQEPGDFENTWNDDFENNMREGSRLFNFSKEIDSLLDGDNDLKNTKEGNPESEENIDIDVDENDERLPLESEDEFIDVEGYNGSDEEVYDPESNEEEVDIEEKDKRSHAESDEEDVDVEEIGERVRRESDEEVDDPESNQEDVDIEENDERARTESDEDDADNLEDADIEENDERTESDEDDVDNQEDVDIEENDERLRTETDEEDVEVEEISERVPYKSDEEEINVEGKDKDKRAHPESGGECVDVDVRDKDEPNKLIDVERETTCKVNGISVDDNGVEDESAVAPRNECDNDEADEGQAGGKGDCAIQQKSLMNNLLDLECTAAPRDEKPEDEEDEERVDHRGAVDDKGERFAASGLPRASQGDGGIQDNFGPEVELRVGRERPEPGPDARNDGAPLKRKSFELEKGAIRKRRRMQERFEIAREAIQEFQSECNEMPHAERESLINELITRTQDVLASLERMKEGWK